jgi:hypothetical protein
MAGCETLITRQDDKKYFALVGRFDTGCRVVVSAAFLAVVVNCSHIINVECGGLLKNSEKKS